MVRSSLHDPYIRLEKVNGKIEIYEKMFKLISHDLESLRDEKRILSEEAEGSRFKIPIKNIFTRFQPVETGNTEWIKSMKILKESQVKEAFIDILGGAEVPKDWGGEDNDMEITITAGGRSCRIGFILKGPRGKNYFKELTMPMLGANGDQVIRASRARPEIIVLQHCHDISSAVEEHLIAQCMAYQSSYCLIDGRHTYAILKAYNKI